MKQLFSPDDGSELFLEEDGYYHSLSNDNLYEIYDGRPIKVHRDETMSGIYGSSVLLGDELFPTEEKEKTKQKEKTVAISVLQYLKEGGIETEEDSVNQTSILVERIKYFAEAEHDRIMNNDSDKAKEEFNDYLNILREEYAKDDSDDISLFSSFTVIGKSCIHKLERVEGENSELLLYGAFNYDEEFKKGLLIPAAIIFGKRNPFDSVQVSPNPKKTSVFNVVSYSKNRNLLNVENISEEFAKEISYNIKNIKPTHYKNEYSTENLKPSLGYVGIIELIILTFIVTLVFGVIMAVEMMN